MPGDADDGTVLYETGHEGLVTTYLDTDLLPDRLYYYALYVSVPYPAWSAAASYRVGDCVTYNGTTYLCQRPTSGSAPSSASQDWRATTNTLEWVRAGAAAGLSVADHRYAQRMYSLLPPAYRTAPQEITTENSGTNEDLTAFLTVLGQPLDTAKGRIDLATRLHDQHTTSSTYTERAADMLGLEQPLSARPQLRRARVENASRAARAKGTDAGLRQLIHDLTGWDCDIHTSPNLMADQDQSGMWHPALPSWSAGVRYAAGEYVTYGGRTFRARSSARRIPATSLLPPTTTQTQGTVVAETDKLGTRVLGRNLKNGDAFTLKLTVDTAATYDIALVYTTAPSYGIWTIAIDGETLRTIDGYARTQSTATATLGRRQLAAGDHAIRIAVSGANVASSGWQLGINTLSLTPTDQRLSPVPPAGHPDSGIFWEEVSAPPRDWGLETTPATLDPSTWWLRADDTAARTVPGTLGSQSGITPPDGPHSQYATTALAATAPRAASYTLASIAPAQARPWDAATVYRVGHLVTYQGRTWEAVATASSGQAPGQAKDYWRPSLATDQGVPDPALVASAGVPLPRVSAWTPDRLYQPGEIVAHGRARYEAITANQGEQPANSGSDQGSWAFAGAATELITAAVHARYAGGTTISNLACEIGWYDSTGRPLPQLTATAATTAALRDPFDVDLNDLAGTSVGTSAQKWTTRGGTWSVAAGILSTTPAPAPDGTYLTTALTPQPTGPVSLAVTVLSRPTDPSALHGLAVHATSNGGDFTIAARDGLYRIRKTDGGYQADQLATYPPLADGDRLILTYDGDRLIVVKKANNDDFNTTDLARYTYPSAPQTTGSYVGLAEIKR
ncbi:carbohydrate-binding protein [Streptomyces sp. NRRL F-4489]|uniref:carbohydrate-binding protein n=1 Tax=Streptomyces sp. NRRL F-4489 TaxID=1609095 RepID=UPI00131B9DFD|nr:carbohydrate-binding protein [Streptomyces sp. NRRL F-4489]